MAVKLNKKQIKIMLNSDLNELKTCKDHDRIKELHEEVELLHKMLKHENLSKIIEVTAKTSGCIICMIAGYGFEKSGWINNMVKFFVPKV